MSVKCGMRLQRWIREKRLAEDSVGFGLGSAICGADEVEEAGTERGISVSE